MIQIPRMLQFFVGGDVEGRAGAFCCHIRLGVVGRTSPERRTSLASAAADYQGFTLMIIGGAPRSVV